MICKNNNFVLLYLLKGTLHTIENNHICIIDYILKIKNILCRKTMDHSVFVLEFEKKLVTGRHLRHFRGAVKKNTLYYPQDNVLSTG